MLLRLGVVLRRRRHRRRRRSGRADADVVLVAAPRGRQVDRGGDGGAEVLGVLLQVAPRVGLDVAADDLELRGEAFRATEVRVFLREVQHHRERDEVAHPTAALVGQHVRGQRGREHVGDILVLRALCLDVGHEEVEEDLVDDRLEVRVDEVTLALSDDVHHGVQRHALASKRAREVHDSRPMEPMGFSS